MKRSYTWTCQRVTNKIKCGHVNPNMKRTCGWCGKPRPARKRPAHMSALALSYEYYTEINGGEHCGICGRPPTPGRRLDRDHCHKGVGTPRGLLCWQCNKWLREFMEPAWLRAAAAYLERSDTQNVSLDIPVAGAGGVKSPAYRSFARGDVRPSPGRGTNPSRGSSA